MTGTQTNTPDGAPETVSKTHGQILEQIASELRKGRVNATRVAAPETELCEDHTIPLSTYYAEKQAGRGPRTFKVGRRNYVLIDDWGAWLRARAEPVVK